jgi:predicted transcriptional regulator of viral defense system
MRDARAVATAHGGAITTKMAAEHGISRQQLYWLSHTADVLVNVESGAYILSDSEFGFADVAARVYLMAERFRAVVVASHETALAMHQVSDAMPPVTYVTADRTPFRWQHPMRGVRLMFAPLPESDRLVHLGIPVTTVERSIVDTVDTNIDLAVQAAREVVTERRSVQISSLAQQIVRQFSDRGEQERVAHALRVRGLITEVGKQR